MTKGRGFTTKYFLCPAEVNFDASYNCPPTPFSRKNKTLVKHRTEIIIYNYSETVSKDS